MTTESCQKKPLLQVIYKVFFRRLFDPRNICLSFHKVLLLEEKFTPEGEILSFKSDPFLKRTEMHTGEAMSCL